LDIQTNSFRSSKGSSCFEIKARKDTNACSLIEAYFKQMDRLDRQPQFFKSLAGLDLFLHLRVGVVIILTPPPLVVANSSAVIYFPPNLIFSRWTRVVVTLPPHLFMVANSNTIYYFADGNFKFFASRHFPARHIFLSDLLIISGIGVALILTSPLRDYHLLFLLSLHSVNYPTFTVYYTIDFFLPPAYFPVMLPLSHSPLCGCSESMH
jgi:hypothetical protein